MTTTCYAQDYQNVPTATEYHYVDWEKDKIYNIGDFQPNFRNIKQIEQEVLTKHIAIMSSDKKNMLINRTVKPLIIKT